MSKYHDLSDGIEFSDDRMSILQIFRNGDIRPLTLSMPNLRGGFGSFLTSSVAKFEKKFLKTFELILSSKQCSPSVFRQIFEGLSCLEGRPSDFRLFHNSFGLPIFSFSFPTM